MGFFGLVDKPTRQLAPARGVSIELLHKQQCRACPLNHSSCATPKMEPTGDTEGLIYVIGAAPNEAADERGKPFAGEWEKLIRLRMPKKLLSRVRFNNVVRTHPGQDKKGNQLRTPTQVEIECCRPSIIADIEATQPTVVIGLGGVPLKWAINETHVNHWAGRRAPARFGKHVCWFYPLNEPETFLRMRKDWDDGHLTKFTSDDEFAFTHSLRMLAKDLDSLRRPVIHTEEFARANCDVIDGSGGASDLKAIEKHIDDCMREKTNGFDYETNRLRPYNKGAKILTAAIARKSRSLAFAIEHPEAKWGARQLETVHDMLAEYLCERGPIKAVHQLAFEMEWSAFTYGNDVLRSGLWADTISQAFVLNELQGMLSLEDLCMQYFGFNIKSLSNVDRNNLENTPLANVLPYNAMDAKYHLLLHHEQMPLLEQQDLMQVYKHHVKRIPALVLTQLKGIPVDQETVKAYRRDYEGDLFNAEDELFDLAAVRTYNKRNADKFNPGSTHDVQRLLKQIGEPSASTDEAVLTRLKHPAGKAIIKWRKASKVLSTYITPVTMGHVDTRMMDDGLIHPIISATKVETSRTSSEDPNVQNWPTRGANKEIREVVAVDADHRIYAFDYASIQARNVAMESLDRKLVQHFIDWYDIHADWTERIARKYPAYIKEGVKQLANDKKLFKSYRSVLKNKFVFPSFFGAAPSSIARGLDVPVDKMESLQEDFWEEFPDVHGWHDDLRTFFNRHGYVTGLSGYRRRAPIGYNQLINAPIQADETIIVLSAMIALSEREHPVYQPIMEIHDDLTFILPNKGADAYAETIAREMCKHRFDWINVPIVVEMKVGKDWGNMEEVAVFESTGGEDFREVKGK